MNAKDLSRASALKTFSTCYVRGIRHKTGFDGLRGWVEKVKLGGEFAKAPIAMDMKQAMGALAPPATAGNMQWFSPSPRIPYSSHVQPGGESLGGNFLFEDARVVWHKSRDVDPALTGQGWVFYYKVPLN